MSLHGAVDPVAQKDDQGSYAAQSLIEDPELLKRFGITRVGDITDLDIVGVPVWFAVRPNSRGLSVSQGKGMTAQQARISAVMEAIEGAVAEDTQRHVQEYGPIRLMRQRNMPLVPLDTMSRVNRDKLDLDRERAWVKGYSVRKSEPVFAPYEVVGLDFRADFPWDRQAFRMSSQGLAAGFDPDHAILHALLELVENDACFMLDAFDTRGTAMRPVCFPSGWSRYLDELLGHLERAGIAARFFDLTSSNCMPVIMSALPRSIIAANGPGKRIAAGIACRLTVQEAAVAALLEAIQSRLTDISGARDDLSAERYRIDEAAVEWLDIPSVAVTPISSELANKRVQAADWRDVANHLFSAGIDDIFVFSLESGVSNISVVRVLASGLMTAGEGLNNVSIGVLDNFLRR